MPNSRQRLDIRSPSSSRAMNFSRSSMGSRTFQGILRPPQKARLCYPCARNELSPLSQEGQVGIRTPDTVRLNTALFRQKKSRFRVSLHSLSRLRRTPSPHSGTKVSVADFGGTVRDVQHDAVSHRGFESDESSLSSPLREGRKIRAPTLKRRGSNA